MMLDCSLYPWKPKSWNVDGDARKVLTRDLAKIYYSHKF